MIEEIKAVGTGFYGENGIVFQDEDEHIIENIKRVLSTRRGERIGNLSFGSDVRNYLFAPELSIDDLINEIVNSLKRCEPRVQVLECSLSSFHEDTVDIYLRFQIKRSKKILETKIEL